MSAESAQADARGSAEPVAQTTPPAPPPEPGASILLVDDRPENLLALEAVLKDLAPRLVRAKSGDEALKRVLEEDFAAILLDVQMPGLDGFETAALIRQRERSRHTPILFLTAINKADAFIFKGYSHGAVDYILKPFVPEILRAKVAVFVELFESRERLRQQAAQLADINAELRRSNAELEQFASVASHDLREPLRKVAAFSELLSELCGSKLDEHERGHLAFIADSATRMQALVEGLLELARVGREQRKEEVDLDKLVGRVIDDLAFAIQESGARVSRERLPVLLGDPVLLARLFQNLISNAVKFRGPEPSRVRLSARRQGRDWVFSVRDNGIGIDPSSHEHIFELFRRLHGRSRFPGSGIGLAICKRVVEHHGGEIWVESEPGRGADFRFTLPASQERP